MTIILQPEYASLRDALSQIVVGFDDCGKLLYDKRNQVRMVEADGVPLVVKRFKHLSAWRAFVYRYIRANKAQRAYENALRLIELGVRTPAPVAWIHWGRYYYFVCLPTSNNEVKEELVLRQPYNADMVQPYADFLAKLHELGVWHKDLNPTNVLYGKADNGDYYFELIDINRMRFYAPRPMPKKDCMKNLTTVFWEPEGVFREVLARYAEVRGWSAEDVEVAWRMKIESNKEYARRKHWAHPIKFLRRKIKGQ